MCHGGLASRNCELMKEDFIVDDVCADGDAEYDDQIVDCYGGDDICKLFPEVCDLKRRFPNIFAFVHVWIDFVISTPLLEIW